MLARQLRKNATGVERELWKKLRRKQLGVQFRRQFPIGGYVVDFYCPQHKLALELDGKFHRLRKDYDKIRTERLEYLGVKILRFWNKRVIEEIDSVIYEIRIALKNSTLSQ